MLNLFFTGVAADKRKSVGRFVISNVVFGVYPSEFVVYRLSATALTIAVRIEYVVEFVGEFSLFTVFAIIALTYPKFVTVGKARNFYRLL